MTRVGGRGRGPPRAGGEGRTRVIGGRLAENERPEGAQGERRNVYITLHRNFVREGIEYTDRRTGETRTFNQVTLPAGTVIDGRDVGGYEFSPLYVNPSRFRGEH